MIMVLLFFFFFKQKTSYEMRISDWSSDVCSSDLRKRAYDFALWHAAETAKARGFVALKVEKERRDADVSVQRERTHRSEERRVGKECGSTCRSRWSA